MYEEDLNKYYKVKIQEAERAKKTKPIPYKIGAEDG